VGGQSADDNNDGAEEAGASAYFASVAKQLTVSCVEARA
jgi:hypothetical protein